MDVYTNLTLVVDDMIEIKTSTQSPWFLFENSTENYTDVNGTELVMRPKNLIFQILPIITVVLYALVFVAGLLGNCLVIYVVTMFSKMKTVTNMYIVNLAVADVMFLISMPFLMTTTILKHWTFGNSMCKIYMILVSINYFTGIFTLTVMSADRYMAVCHPIQSVTIRTPKISFILCVLIWVVSILIMMPTFLYSKTVFTGNRKSETCTIAWPSSKYIQGNKAFVWYCFFLSYAIPMALISFFYIMVIIRLKNLGPATKSKEKKKSHRKVTKMVLTIVGVYMLFWLPYWVFQLILILMPLRRLEVWEILLFNAFTVLTLANSMMNPLLYNFLSDNFRKSFAKAFACVSQFEANKALAVENSMYPRNNQRTEFTRCNDEGQENYEMPLTKVATTIVKVENTFAQVEKETNLLTDKGHISKNVNVNHDGDVDTNSSP